MVTNNGCKEFSTGKPCVIEDCENCSRRYDDLFSTITDKQRLAQNSQIRGEILKKVLLKPKLVTEIDGIYETGIDSTHTISFMLSESIDMKNLLIVYEDDSYWDTAIHFIKELNNKNEIKGTFKQLKKRLVECIKCSNNVDCYLKESGANNKGNCISFHTIEEKENSKEK